MNGRVGVSFVAVGPIITSVLDREASHTGAMSTRITALEFSEEWEQ